MQQIEEKKLRVVLDTNVVVSHIWGSRNASIILKAALHERRFLSLVSLALLDELHYVLNRPAIKASFAPNNPNLFIEEYGAAAIHIKPDKKLNVCADPYDNILFECALAGRADYIVSGDKAVLSVREYKGIKVVSPGEFIRKALRTI